MIKSLALGAALALSLYAPASAQPGLGILVQSPTGPISSDPDACADAGVFSDCSGKDIKRAKASRALKQEVGLAAAEGRCDEAVKKALKFGDFDLATKVKGLCQPAAETAPAKP